MRGYRGGVARRCAATRRGAAAAAPWRALCAAVRSCAQLEASSGGRVGGSLGRADGWRRRPVRPIIPPPTGTGTGTGTGLPGCLAARTHAGPAGRLVHMPRAGVEDEVEVPLAVARLLVDQTCARLGLGLGSGSGLGVGLGSGLGEGCACRDSWTAAPSRRLCMLNAGRLQTATAISGRHGGLADYGLRSAVRHRTLAALLWHRVNHRHAQWGWACCYLRCGAKGGAKGW